MDLGWIGGGLGWIGVDWPCFHVQLCTQNVGNCENGEGQNFREQGSFIILKETRRAISRALATAAHAGAAMRYPHVVRVIRILHRRRQFEDMKIRTERRGNGLVDKRSKQLQKRKKQA